MLVNETEKLILCVALNYLEEIIENEVFLRRWVNPIHPYLKTKEGLKEIVDLRKKTYKEGGV